MFGVRKRVTATTTSNNFIKNKKTKKNEVGMESPKPIRPATIFRIELIEPDIPGHKT